MHFPSAIDVLPGTTEYYFPCSMKNPNEKDVSFTKCSDPTAVSNIVFDDSSRRKSVWKDLPYRLCTICVGVPSLWMIWCNDTLRLVSFHVIHLLCCYEFMYHITTAYETNKRKPGSGSSPKSLGLQLHQFLFVALSFVLVNIPASLFPPSLLFVLSFITVLIITTMQSRDSTYPTSAQLVLEEAKSSLILLRILLSWYQGLFFIMIPFRVWIGVTTRFPVSRADDAFLSAKEVHISGFRPTVSLLFTVWNCDTGALVVGRIFGQKYVADQATGRSLTRVLRHWLYYVSPTKSLEGLCGGIVAGILTYVYFLPRFWYLIELYRIPTGSTTTPFVESDFDQCGNENVWFAFWIGCVLSSSSILGDMLESSLKRLYHCKDSGRVLPGHGGIYDRFDSSLIAIVIYHFCFLSPLGGQGQNNCSIVATRGY
jgi:CDP-diglyceride synthetase